MNAPLDAVITENAAWAKATPVLSVLIPFYRYDPIPLLEALDREGAQLHGRAEIVVLDDGGGDQVLAEAVAGRIGEFSIPIRFVRLLRNEGRARGRNRLADQARARHLLFLDCDMIPDGPDFLGAWLRLVAEEDPAVAFGGFAAPKTVASEFAVHRAMALRGDCAPAETRCLQPEKYVFTSNLLVRRDVFEAEGFDESFAGWGWEDVEWGMRVARRWPIRHVDNDAIHLGLDTPERLAAKYEQSVANFARVAARHPEIVAAYPSHRVARALKRAPLLKAWRPLLKEAALAEALPVSARVLALKLYRAALYAEVV